MAYPEFHQPHPDLEDLVGEQLPVFHDTDGSPVYDAPEEELLCAIICRNDISALHRYNSCPHTRIFLPAYVPNYYNPFSTAFGCHSYDAVRALIQIYLSDPSLTEPLLKYVERLTVSLVNNACSAADRDLVLWLINHDPPLGTLRDRSFNDRTPLLCAAEALGEVGGLMVDAKAGESLPVARQKAREHRDHIEDFIYWLLKSGCSVSESDAFEPDYTCDTTDSEKVRLLTGTVLGAAIPYASQAMVSHLIANGADVHTRQVWYPPGGMTPRGITPLHIAASYGNLEAVQTLMDLRGDVELSKMVSVADDEGRLPLHWALHGERDMREEKDNSEEIVSQMAGTIQTLIDVKPGTVDARDRHGATTFHYAVKTGLGSVAVPRAIDLLLSANPSPDTLNARDSGGITALGAATRPFSWWGGDLDRLVDVAKTLITNGADARLCAYKGRSFLHELSYYSWAQPISPALLDFLLETVDINQADADGCTALHYLVKNLDQDEAIRHLIRRGADVTAIDNQGNTPLHEVMKGKMLRKMYAGGELEPLAPDLLQRTRDKLIHALLNAGASMERTNLAGQTPKQVLDRALEERERQERQDAARRGQRSEGSSTRDRGRVVRYVPW